MADGAQKVIVLDRDGVINFDSDDYIKSADEWLPIPGSIEAIARLKEAGYRVAIATNQSGIGRGYYSEDTLTSMHQKLRALLSEHTDQEIDLIVYCPHKPDEGCDCRKPKTGLLDEIESSLELSLSGHHLVGDSLKDLEVAQAKGMNPILVRTGKGTDTENKGGLPEGTQIQESLERAVNQLLTQS